MTTITRCLHFIIKLSTSCFAARINECLAIDNLTYLIIIYNVEYVQARSVINSTGALNGGTCCLN